MTFLHFINLVTGLSYLTFSQYLYLASIYYMSVLVILIFKFVPSSIANFCQVFSYILFQLNNFLIVLFVNNCMNNKYSFWDLL